jgi:DNA invertase Pin-like site-specific DNA recombinase
MAERVAIYTRVSTGSQSTENQARELRTVAERAGWEIVRIYSDHGISGSKGREGRPAFRAMCVAAARREFDLVAAWSVDRLSRNLKDLIGFVGELQALNIGLYLQVQAIDTSTPSGKALLQMCGIFAELERSIVRERVLIGLGRARAEGKRLGRPRIDSEKEARISEALRQKHMGIRKIAANFGVGIGTVQRVKTEMASMLPGSAPELEGGTVAA